MLAISTPSASRRGSTMGSRGVVKVPQHNLGPTQSLEAFSLLWTPWTLPELAISFAWSCRAASLWLEGYAETMAPLAARKEMAVMNFIVRMVFELVVLIKVIGEDWSGHDRERSEIRKKLIELEEKGSTGFHALYILLRTVAM